MNTPAQTPRRGEPSRCSAFADLLPLLDSPGLGAEQDTAVRAHLSSCAACQAQRAAYYQMTLEARRSLSPAATTRRHQTEELLASILQEMPAAPETGVSSPPRQPVKLHRPIRPRRLIASLAPLVIVVVIVVVAATLLANHPRPTRNTGTNPQTPKGSWSGLSAISMVSADEGWAAGVIESSCTANFGSCQKLGPLLMHYHGGKWSSVPLSSTEEPLDTISMLSATDGWASSEFLILHYDGHTWKSMPTPNRMLLNHLQMLSDTDGWATGSIEGPLAEPAAILHYDGQTWTPQPLPASLGITQQNPILFGNLTMLSPTEGWAVGTLYKKATAVVLHYANGQWTLQSSTNNADLDSISMTSATDGWAVGTTGTGSVPLDPYQPGSSAVAHPFLLHYTQGKWTQVTTLNNTYGGADSISMDSATDGWAVGPHIERDGNGSLVTHLLHYNGQQWVPVPAFTFQHQAVGIMGLHMLSATDGWAVGALETIGAQSDSNGRRPIPLSLTRLILHYHNGTWSIFPTS